MEKEKAFELWDAIFGKKEWVKDCYGTYIYKYDYGDTKTLRERPGGDGNKYSYGWEVDHIRPKSSFNNPSDADFFNNYELVHWINNRDKADNYPDFNLGGNSYKVVNCSICASQNTKGYGIIDSNNRRIDWKGVSNNCFVAK